VAQRAMRWQRSELRGEDWGKAASHRPTKHQVESNKKARSCPCRARYLFVRMGLSLTPNIGPSKTHLPYITYMFERELQNEANGGVADVSLQRGCLLRRQGSQGGRPSSPPWWRRHWLEWTSAREEREEFQPIPVGFRPIYCPSNNICKGRRLANIRAFKSFMVRAIFTDADLHRF
jgi:hypothetical protein